MGLQTLILISLYTDILDMLVLLSVTFVYYMQATV